MEEQSKTHGEIFQGLIDNLIEYVTMLQNRINLINKVLEKTNNEIDIYHLTELKKVYTMIFDDLSKTVKNTMSEIMYSKLNKNE
jgi:hypothetical protein